MKNYYHKAFIIRSPKKKRKKRRQESMNHLSDNGIVLSQYFRPPLLNRSLRATKATRRRKADAFTPSRLPYPVTFSLLDTELDGCCLEKITLFASGVHSCPVCSYRFRVRFAYGATVGHSHYWGRVSSPFAPFSAFENIRKRQVNDS